VRIQDLEQNFTQRYAILAKESRFLGVLKAGYFVGLALVAVGLSFSHSLISIGVGVLGFLGLLLPFTERSTGFSWKPLWGEGSALRWMSLSFGFLYLLQALSWFYTEDKAQWFVEMRIKVPFLFLLPVAVFAWQCLSVVGQKAIHLLFQLALAIVGIGSLYRLWVNPSWALSKIYHGGYVPLLGGLSHIYYAGLVGMALLFLLALPVWGGIKVRLGLALIHLGVLHGLALRTGLLAVYGTALVLLIWWGLRDRRRWIWTLTALAGMALGLPFLVCKVPTLRMRWVNMQRDLATYKPGGYITHSSISRRLAALEAAWLAFKKSPLFGVGMADNFAAISQEIPKLPYKWDKETYILPHNQFVEYGMGLGVVGVVVFGLFWGVAFRQKLGWLWTGWLVYWLLLMQGEAFLERQVGVTAFLWGTGLLWATLTARKS
jgi:O-antigen ligase